MSEGIKDPAIQGLTDEQLRAANYELARREDVARRAREQEQARRRQLAETELALQFQGKLWDLLKAAGWTEPLVYAGPSEAWDKKAQLLESVYDLMDDYQIDRDAL